MMITTKLKRFEITIACNERLIKHVCAAHEEADAVGRVLHSYAEFDPKLIRVKRLGALPKPCDGSTAKQVQHVRLPLTRS